MVSAAEQTGLPGPEHLPDQRVVDRVLNGEPELFELIMRRYNRRLFRIARSILLNDADAEDAVQDGYVRAYLKLGQFRGPDGFAGWLSRIITNEALMRRRREAPHSEVTTTLERPLSQEASMIHSGSPAADPEGALHETQLQRLLETAIDALPEHFRVAFVLREVEQLTVAETAACLGVESTTVKTRVHRARQLLQKNITEDLSGAISGTFAFDGERCDRLVAGVFRHIAELSR